MEKFSLDNLLRHGFSGAVFLITVLVVYPKDLPDFSHLESSLLVALGTGAVLLFGSLIYVIHRILYHLAIYPLLIRQVWGKEHPSLMTLDLNRFRRRTNKRSLQHFMVEWASQAHFLYCVAWAIFLGLMSGYPLFRHWGPRAGWRLGILATAISILAAFHNLRYLTYEQEIERQDSKANSVS